MTFSWDVPEAERLASAWSQLLPTELGGPALDTPQTVGDSFTPERYVKTGVVFTSRGCDRACPWCLVPEREGPLRELPVEDGWVINDNNFMQTSREHQQAVFSMLSRQPKPAQFTGGIDARLVDDWFVQQLRSIRLEWIFLAADTKHALRALEAAKLRLEGFSRKKLRCYALIGRDETRAEATERLERIWSLGMTPHAQLYQPKEGRISYSAAWRKLARAWSRPIIMGAMHRKPRPTPQISLFDSGDEP